ncbi:hypothetical protein QQ045_011441 [Rhodiola kirilowii]
MDWVQKGDRNTAFFHTALKARGRGLSVNLDMGDDTFSCDPDTIGNAAALHFASILQGHTAPPPDRLMSLITPVISDVDNESLNAIPSEDDIFYEISNMNGDSSPGPDGFSGHFYTFHWSTIKEDFTRAVQGFFEGLQMPNAWSTTLLTLIPKVPNVTSISQLRPISLCNFGHKVVARILNSQLAKQLDKIISPEQSGFLQGRNIHENIGLAHDLTHELHAKRRGGNVIIKLDMAKAYDRISWGFIISVLQNLGFDHRWCDMVLGASLIAGVRQGDPLSSSLFVIAMEWFSHQLNNKVATGRILPYDAKCPAMYVNHLLYADDLLLFTNGSKPSLNQLKDLVKEFCTISDQALNNEKSLVFFSKDITPVRKKDILDLTGFSEGTLPVPYLGAPLFRGIAKIEYFSYLVDRVRRRISGWMRHHLSMAGRAILVNSILRSMPLHVVASLPVPKTILRRIESLMASFIWDQGDQKRHHWIRWAHICRNKASGGLGIKPLADVQLAFQGKLAWAYISSDSLWAGFNRAKHHGVKDNSQL